MKTKKQINVAHCSTKNEKEKRSTTKLASMLQDSVKVLHSKLKNNRYLNSIVAPVVSIALKTTHSRGTKTKKEVKKTKITIQSTTKRKYNLNYKVRKQGYRLDCAKKTIYVPYLQEELSNQVELLRKEYNYQIQYEIQ